MLEIDKIVLKIVVYEKTKVVLEARQLEDEASPGAASSAYRGHDVARLRSPDKSVRKFPQLGNYEEEPIYPRQRSRGILISSWVDLSSEVAWLKEESFRCE